MQVFTNVDGRALDNPEFLPLFELMASYDLPIWIRPARGAEMPDYDPGRPRHGPARLADREDLPGPEVPADRGR